MSKELTKIINQKCQDCGKQINILCNERCQILAVRCPDCFQIFLINAIEIKQLIGYLKRKGWEELPTGNKNAIRICSPNPTYYLSIPAKRDLIDYKDAIKNVINSIAGYYDKTMDEIISEILQEENFD